MSISFPPLVLIYPLGKVSSDIHGLELWIITFFVCGFLFQISLSNNIQMLTASIMSFEENKQHYLFDSISSKTISAEDILIQSLYDGQNDRKANILLISVISCLPFFLGFSIGILEWLDWPTIIAYIIYRLLLTSSLSSTIQTFTRNSISNYIIVI